LPERLLAETFRIDIRGIEEVNAAIDRSLDQPIGFALTDCADHFEETSTAPEGHGAKAKARDQ
jgi:hypothetical protein